MTTTNSGPAYGLRMSEAERMRYRMMAARALEQEAERWRAAGVVPGARVADVGCGPGAVLVELARIVGDAGEVVGVEPDAEARAAAREELDAAGFAAVRVLEGNGEATGLERLRSAAQRERFAGTPGAVMWLPMFLSVGRRPV